MNLQYRKEIDGLRAIAVIAIIFFHAGLPSVMGGYVGVDIFFVISGYLITSIIIRQVSDGTFTFRQFYERRALRILPALFFVLLLLLPVAWFSLLPNDLKEFSASLRAVLLFSSNFFFWKDSGYFSPVAELRPLIHTWSLAVEEQYYILFPVLMVLLLERIKPRRVIYILISIALTSLLLAQWSTNGASLFGFFLLPTRVWEFVLGALVALLLQSRPGGLWQPIRAIQQIFSVLGLLLVLYPIFYFPKLLPYPGYWTLIPTTGAALVLLFANDQTYVGKLLTLRPLSLLGLSSYSSYLWHQPLFAFARLRDLEPPAPSLMYGMIAASFVFGYLTWRYIEPIWRSGVLATSRSFYYSIVIVVGIFIIFFTMVKFADTRLNRLTHLPRDYFQKSWIDFKFTGLDGQRCYTEHMVPCSVAKVNDASHNILLVGDSHAGDYGNDFKNFLDTNAYSGAQFSVPGCTFVESQANRNNGDCGRAREQLLSLASEKKFDIYILTGEYTQMTSVSAPSQRAEDLRSFTTLVQGLLRSGATVFYLKPRLLLQYDPQRAGALNLNNRNRGLPPVPDNIRAWEQTLSGLLKYEEFLTFDETAALVAAGCGSVNCFDGHSKNGYLLYRDITHLTDLGAKVVFDAFIHQYGSRIRSQSAVVNY